MRTTRGPRAVRGGALLRTGAALTTCAVLGAVVVQARTDSPARFDLQGGGAWVASTTVGQMTLIDGGSAEVVARVAVGSPGADLRSAQYGMVGYGVDRDRGTVARIDPASFVAAPPVAVIEGAQGEVAVHPTRDLVYVVDHQRGRVGATDETAVASLRGEIQSLAEPVGSSVVDGGGRLWTLGRATGDLTWFDGTERHSRPAVAADPATAELVTIDGEPAIVERGERTVRTIEDDGGTSGETCLEIDPADASIAVGGSARAARLYVASGDDGLLRVSDVGARRCGDVVVEVAPPGSELGTPQEAQEHVFVPDFTSGTVAIVDIASRRVTHTGVLVTPSTVFELFAEDGIVFYNDPASERAGVVSVDGTFAPVAKYDPERPGEGLDPDDDAEGSPTPDAAARGTGEGVDEGAPGGDAAGTAGGVDPGTPEPPGAGGRTDRAPSEADPPAGEPEPTVPVPPGSPVDGPRDGPDGPGTIPGDLVIEATASQVPVGEELTLRARAVRGGLRDVTWSFGDGTAGTGPTTAHAWEATGAYMVVAQGTLDAGTVVTGAATITVVEPTGGELTAAFSWTPATVVAGSPVTFIDESTGDPTSWSWAFEGATGSGTSSRRVPPPQTWDVPGRFTVGLVVGDGSATDRHETTITVVAPEPAAPQLTAITSTPDGPYDDQTDYEFSTTVGSGPFTSCSWTIEAVTSPCTPSAGPAGTRVSTRHRFGSGGPTTVGVAVGGPAGADTETLTIDVQVPPVPVITVSGASGSGGSYTADEGATVTFDGGSSTGTYDSLAWRDESTGAAVEGRVWAPALVAGVHTITLTARSARFGDRSSAVTVDVRPGDPTPPEVSTDETTGSWVALGVLVSANDPETGITRIDVYGRVTAECVVDGVSRPIDLDFTATPFDSGTGSELLPRNDGGPGVSFSGLIELGCPIEATMPTLSVRFWSVATNGAGQTARSADLVRGF
jgi:PKD repeat protein